MAGYTSASPTFARPHVSYIADEDLVIYDDLQPETDWSKEYLTFLALEDGTFTLSRRGSILTGTTSYSLDDGNTWTELAADTPTPTVTAGSKIMFKGTIGGTFSQLQLSVESTGRFEAMGNPYSLNYDDDFVVDTLYKNKCPSNLFSQCTGLTNAENLVLPATTLTEHCYENMFNGCTNLVKAPKALPATTLADSCYDSMFEGCTSLTTAPELPATTLAQSCYNDMFRGCTSLATAPVLPATTLAGGCYYVMFEGCTSLTTAPELLAATLVENCYGYMFRGCTSLNYIKMLATDVSASSCLYNWVRFVSANGTFIKHPDATLPSGDMGIPAGWTVQTATE